MILYIDKLLHSVAMFAINESKMVTFLAEMYNT